LQSRRRVAWRRAAPSSDASGFVSRPTSEIASLLKAAYGEDPTGLQSRLGTIAQALNRRDFAFAAIAAVQTRTPELSAAAAARLASADKELTKYDQDEPRDWHGRWTSGGAPPGQDEASREVEPKGPNFSTPGRDTAAENIPQDASSPEQAFEKKYDDLGPVDFAKRAIEFGDWLARAGRNLSPVERDRALAEYSFLQDRLSFWLSYEYKPAIAHANVLSAALALYQGAINGGIVQVGDFPRSMLDVAGAAWAFDNVPPRRILPSTKSPGSRSAGSVEAPREADGLGGIVNNSEAKIDWTKGIKDQGDDFETYYGKENPNVRQLRPGTKAFDYFDDATGEAVSTKTLNTLSVSRIRNPQKIFDKIKEYVDAAIDYERVRETDLDPADIKSKTIHLAIPEYTSPTQWRYLNRVIIYAKENGVTIVITRIRE
jgi:hypothetical protein